MVARPSPVEGAAREQHGELLVVGRPVEQARPAQRRGDEHQCHAQAVRPEDEAEHDEVDAAVITALSAGDTEALKELVDGLHYADVADVVERLNEDKRAQFLTELGDDLPSEVWAELDDAVRETVFEDMEPAQIAAAVSELDSDDAVEIVEEMEEPDQKAVLEAMAPPDRRLIEQSLSYPDDSAGRLMQREIVTVPTNWTVGETIDYMRAAADGDEDILPTSFYDIFVVDPTHKPVGAIHLSHLLRSKRPIKVSEIMQTELKLLPVTMDQEDVAFLFRQRDLVSAPVVDEAQRLVGAITIDDVVDVIHEEHEEDMLALAGVGEADLYDAAIDTTKARFRWLLVNLFTAILASMVIGLFETTLERVVALAILMPIVASMGGNAGTQTLTVAVRALAVACCEAIPQAAKIARREHARPARQGVLRVRKGHEAVTWPG